MSPSGPWHRAAPTFALVACLAIAACNPGDLVLGTQNGEPTSVIQGPVDGVTLTSAQAVELVGVVTDPNGLQDVSSVFWQSNLDGELADLDSAMLDVEGLTRLSTTLTEGTHVVTLSVVDSVGQRGEDSIGIQIIPPDLVPRATISQPGNLERVDPGDDVQLVGRVSDGQQASETLSVRWQITAASGDVILDIPSSADAEGVTTESFEAPPAGQAATYDIALIAVDDDAYEGRDTVPIVVSDPGSVDRDNDDWPLSVDCDDDDPLTNPGAPEVCGDAKDNDCNGFIDDKDVDQDLHIDEQCVNYNGQLPIDDCLDNNDQVFTGAFEVPNNNIDDDCDGIVDNNGPEYDSDGDCYCEGPNPCTGSTVPACVPVLQTGDCVEGDAGINPGVLDEPDVGYIDADCDGIDGDVDNAIFVDAQFGNDGNTGTIGSPKRSLDAAIETAEFEGFEWVLLSNGTYPFTETSDQFVEGVSIAGGYDASIAWARTTTRPEIEVSEKGQRIVGWSTPTQFQQLRITAESAVSSGAASVVLWARDTVGLSLVETVLTAGNGAPGDDGTGGADGCSGEEGVNGTDGCVFGTSTVNTCGQCNDVGESVPVPAPGGNGCVGGGNGGSGGQSGLGDMDDIDSEFGDDGGPGSGFSGGDGGRRGQANGGDGVDGNDGTSGMPGVNGAGGQGIGEWNDLVGYASSDGANGLNGEHGSGGGGGGGGAGGGWGGLVCDVYGGGGGGGGEGGARGRAGLGGEGGGASVALVLTGITTVVIEGGELQTGNGGEGGRGGTGGFGGDGGDGGHGGSRPLRRHGCLRSVAAGSGGTRGYGGDGGHGGGGGGGPVFGVWCAGPSAT
ncbi:MAG: putative metal-binding motif-containing protein, partial [Myxococcota bacterium]